MTSPSQEEPKTSFAKVQGKPLFIVSGQDELTLYDGTKVKIDPAPVPNEPSEFNPEEYEIVSESRDLVAYRRKKPVPSDEISECDNCFCMTHTVNGKCGKCGEPKQAEPSDSRPCPGCGKPVSNVSSMMYCQDCQLKQNERVSAIGDELRDIMFGSDPNMIAQVRKWSEQQTKLARIETAYYIDSMLTFEGIPLRLTQRESIKVYIRQLEASIKERSEDDTPRR